MKELIKKSIFHHIFCYLKKQQNIFDALHYTDLITNTVSHKITFYFMLKVTCDLYFNHKFLFLCVGKGLLDTPLYGA